MAPATGGRLFILALSMFLQESRVWGAPIPTMTWRKTRWAVHVAYLGVGLTTVQSGWCAHCWQAQLPLWLAHSASSARPCGGSGSDSDDGDDDRDADCHAYDASENVATDATERADLTRAIATVLGECSATIDEAT